MDDMEGPEVPRALRDPDARSLRRRLLEAPHMRPLNEYVAGLRKRPGVEVLDFDPLDGGVDACILFLFEKPGRMTVDDGRGSGFISRDNDDPTAEHTFRFMRKARIPRKRAVIWNVIPWWNGTRKVTDAELREGAEETRRLTGLLPRLRAVVFVGEKASRAPASGKYQLGFLLVPSPLADRESHPARRMVRGPVGLGRGGNRRRAEVTDRFPQFVVAPAPHASDVPSNELESFRRADLIMEATDEAGESSYIAVEISFTVNGRDTDRAMLSFSVPEESPCRNRFRTSSVK